ncbi:MAG TPA: molybdopterin cofactor-binding domain-containing protein, partial [Anaerolineae bacterium]
MTNPNWRPDPENKQTGSNPASTGGAEAFLGKEIRQIDDWLAIETDGTVLVKSGKVELGTGTRTALAQIVADELDVAIESVRMVMGDTDKTPNEGYTAGSMTIRRSGGALRLAAAEARAALLEMASESLDASVDELVVRNGIVSSMHHPDQSTTYHELMGGKKFNREFSDATRTKSPKDYRVVGESIPRLDLADKFLGKPSFIHDLHVPGMLHARVIHPPSVGAHVSSLDEGSLGDT